MYTGLIEMLEKATKHEPLQRWELVQMLNMPDRAVRKEIEALRLQGYRICGDGGYWIAKSESEYLEFRRKYVARAKKIYEVAHAMDSSCEGQIAMEM